MAFFRQILSALIFKKYYGLHPFHIRCMVRESIIYEYSVYMVVSGETSLNPVHLSINKTKNRKQKSRERYFPMMNIYKTSRTCYWTIIFPYFKNSICLQKMSRLTWTLLIFLKVYIQSRWTLEML